MIYCFAFTLLVTQTIVFLISIRTWVFDILLRISYWAHFKFFRFFTITIIVVKTIKLLFIKNFSSVIPLIVVWILLKFTWLRLCINLLIIIWWNFVIRPITFSIFNWFRLFNCYLWKIAYNNAIWCFNRFCWNVFWVFLVLAAFCPSSCDAIES